MVHTIMESALYHYNDDLLFQKTMKKICKEKRLLMSHAEMFLLYDLSKRLSPTEGDYIEVGTYKGGSAEIIAVGKGNKTLYICDTFTGLIDCEHQDKYQNEKYYNGMYLSDEVQLRKSMKDYNNIKIVKGIFPNSMKDECIFSFAHLDVDTYNSTLNSLDYIYSRLIIGGIIIIHDYSFANGVKLAVDEYFLNKEMVIRMPTTQALIMKTEKYKRTL